MAFINAKVYSAGFDIQREEGKCWIKVRNGKAYITVPGLTEQIILNENANHVIQIRYHAAAPGPSQAVMFEIERISE